MNCADNGHIRGPGNTCVFCKTPLEPGPHTEHWDAWYASLPSDLKRRLSIHDFKRLGDLFKTAFEINP